jgi:hypothetical protein
MDKRFKILVKDVKQIAYESGMRAITIDRIQRLEKKYNNESSTENFEDSFDMWIKNRIQMVIDRIKNK